MIDRDVVPYLLAPINLRIYRKEKMIIFVDHNFPTVDHNLPKVGKGEGSKHLQISYVGRRMV